MKARKSRATLWLARSRSRANPGPSRGRAMGSLRMRGSSVIWCAARRMATRRAVLLARPCSIGLSVTCRGRAAGYHSLYDLDWMGAALRRVCRRHGPAGQGGSGSRGFEPGHGRSHQRGSGVCVGYRAGHGKARRTSPAGPADAVVSDAVGARDGALVALLLQGAATGSGIAGGSAGQDECAAGDDFRLAAAGRKADRAGSVRGPAHYRGCRGDGAGVRRAAFSFKLLALRKPVIKSTFLKGHGFTYCGKTRSDGRPGLVGLGFSPDISQAESVTALAAEVCFSAILFENRPFPAACLAVPQRLKKQRGL